MPVVTSVDTVGAGGGASGSVAGAPSGATATPAAIAAGAMQHAQLADIAITVGAIAVALLG